MKKIFAVVFPLLLLTAVSFAQDQQIPTQQNQQNDQGTSQQNPPLGDQSTYPAASHKMTPQEKKSTPVGQGQTVDLNSGSKKDIAALPGVGPDRAQSIIDARPFGSKEDLLRKKVVPKETYDQIQDRVTANGPKKQSVPAGSPQN